MGALPWWTRDEVATRILAGETLLIRHGHVIRIPPSWLLAHPGGELAVLHFVGRDATDEIDAYHCDDTLKRMNSYVVAQVAIGEEGWQPLVPPLMSGWVLKTGNDGRRTWKREAAAVRDSKISPSSQILLVKNPNEPPTESSPTLSTLLPPPTTLSPKIQAQHSAAYKALHKQITDAGFYKTPYLSGYGPEAIRYGLLAAMSAILYGRGWLITSAVFLGLFWHQLAFTAHDLGHMGVTHNWTYDRLLGIFIADFLGGLSIGWWVDNHNVHHLVTNHPSHDPDIEHMPFFAISPHFLTSLYSSYYKRIMTLDEPARFFLSMQHKLFYIVMSLGRFNLYGNSYTFLAKALFHPVKAKGGRWSYWLEVLGIGLFWSWYGAVLYGCGNFRMALAYMLVSHIVTSPLHVQIVLSHFSRSTDDLGPTESFPHRQLRTTTDVICPEHLAFIHGGLHLQVTHHLFPRLPRHNLRKASILVKAFAKERGLEYAEFGFIKGNGEVRDVLQTVAEQVKLVKMVADAEVKDAAHRAIAH
ncbi:fatty acid/sphingolipid desaturase [Rickenella mellea]|uniref:Delta 8-(E)-sphingolipid desaturase n=1 Tax=Rickenella mellea TaxID=50990 RepID=A0A4Y7QMJ7_9AGAM|nr:fatty acid/sphingolipid desaturase [Rickenella mellea]